MGEFYAPYPKLPKNIRQIGERDLNVKLYVEDYVNTYLKRLYPAGGQALRVGLLLGEMRSQEGIPYLFADGALEMEGVVQGGENVEFTEKAWEEAYRAVDRLFPKRSVLGWFLCSAPDRPLSPLNYWKQHSRYFPEKNQLMYLSCGLEGEEAAYVASEDGFYHLRGYCIYYERNQMMQDYMVSRRDVRRVESGNQDTVIRDFRQKMEDNREEALRRRGTLSGLQTACGVLSVLVLACGVTLFNNYNRMKEMEAVIASALPEEVEQRWSDFVGRDKDGDTDKSGELVFEEVEGEIYPTRGGLVIEPESMAGEPGQQADGGQAGTPAGTDGQKAQGTGQAREEQPPEMQGNGGQASQSQPEAAAGTQPEAAAGAQPEAAAGTQPEAAAGTQPEGQDLEGEVKQTEASRAEPVQVPSDAVVHIVKDGETLYGICLEYYHSVNNLPVICQWNQLNDENHLSVGQELYLPPAQ
ncbi:MAG: LysM peptidoglycan-binding domain-containing protein [Lachnospiraceae bacterium]|nr:LysM peptidoglycan-binding domain-containing protein [Lachnospiraceae bacterium]